MMPGWYICDNCNAPVREGMEQFDEEKRLLCPHCFLNTAQNKDFTLPEAKR